MNSSVFNNIVSWFANDGETADELQARSDRLDAQKDELDRLAAERIREQLGDEEADAWLADVEENKTREGSGYGLNVNDELDAAYDEGLEEGQGNISRFVRAPFTVLGKALTGVLAGIPVWVWLLGLGALFVYVGGVPWALKQLKKAK